MKKLVLILCFLKVLIVVDLSYINAQSIDHIRNSGEYYFGIGTGNNYQAARRNALEGLSGNISVQVQSEFEQVVEETDEDVSIYTESVVTTYSSAVVNEYEERVLKEQPGDVEVMVYITRTDMQEVFDQREQVIHDFILLGNGAKEELRIADALRYYYWALVLTRSHPDNTELRYDFGGDTELPVMLTLNDRINSIFSFLQVDVEAIEEQKEPPKKNIHLNIKYRGKPVQDLDYYYWMGDGYSSLVSASNGIGYAMLQGVVAKDFSNLRMNIEYQYANKAHLEPEVQMMIENVELPYFERSNIRVKIDDTKSIEPTDRKADFAYIDTENPEYADYKNNIEQVIQAISSGKHRGIQQLFTSEGYNMYEKLIANGDVKVLENRIDTLRILRVGNEVMVRSVPMLFAFHNNRERFIENVVFNFNNDGKIHSLSYSLTNIAIEDIISMPKEFGSKEEKYFLINFMENFKTAYSLKRHDYLNAIFDENALIIVGHVLEQAPEQQIEEVENMYGSLSEKQVEYIRLSKEEYMQRLERIFARNEFINIRFEDNQVRKTQQDDKIYGIQIAQHYYSSTYADKGYLFLMIDLNDINKPKIYVRTWQPEKNPDGSIYGLEDFRF